MFKIFHYFKISALAAFIKEYWLYIFAVLGEISVLLANFILFALVQHRFGSEQLSLYMIIRRAISMILPAVMLGVPLSLIKHIGAISDRRQIVRYIWLGTSIPVMIASSLLIIGISSPELVSKLLLGNKSHGAYVVPLLFLVLSTTLVSSIVAISKGLHKIFHATIFYIIFFTIAPMIAYLFSTSLTGFLIMFATLLLTGALILFTFFIVSYKKFEYGFKGNGRFITFGIKGASSEFLMMFMMWLPPFIIASSDALKISGYFSLMMSLVLVAGSPMAPIGSAMMPKAARAVHTHNMNDLRILLAKIFRLLGIIALPAFVMILFLYGTIANYLLPGSPPMGAKATMVMLTASIPISAYFGLRNMVDVGYSPVRNMFDILTGLVVFIVCFFAVLMINPLAVRMAVVVGFTSAMWILGTLTVYYSYRLINNNDLPTRAMCNLIFKKRAEKIENE